MSFGVFIAEAGVVPNTQSAPNSTKQRLRATRLSGSPARMERIVYVKDNAIMWITLTGCRRVVHRLLGVVDNLFIAPYLTLNALMQLLNDRPSRT